MDDILKEITDLRQVMENRFRQVEALTNLYGIIPVKYAMPKPTKWTASPDFLLFLVSQIQERRPLSILDIGSGATTVWMANALHHFEIPGKIVSVDHDKNFGDATAATLKQQELSTYAQVRIAPLVEVEVKGERWHWYDPMQIEDVEKCDMVVVDGPPGFLQPLSRYPALPMLESKVNSDVRIFMDDASRPDELHIVERWCREYPDWSSEFIDHEKGTAVLKRSR
ncbi:class I SAM-dependent methyltransferase [Streptomyces sp. ME19-01-6]|uniref:class I SAM-dependent methyltransferase n=1 Tax=Streptomyces sp. ME19-01-6 TaxID=3028686 RepID=UPI0029BB3E7C|nr:class I SAM-dependent methyltransferase [Streptomyces sp. ME19-01-6]MDX3225321.1 class I SAM-dependent methyltransferase [Streptomyces sp. ME19-01-6]